MSAYGAIVVALGGACGAVARFWLSGVIARRIGELFPWGTLSVNISGAVAIGAVAAGLPGGGASDSLWRLFIITGFLGGYTTVSSFALQTFTLARVGERMMAAANVLASTILCVAGAGAGFAGMSLIVG
jgi:CrcB protein